MAEGTGRMRQRERAEQGRQPMEQAGKRRKMLQDAREYRMRCYRRMQLEDVEDTEDFSVQEYQKERICATENAERLLDYLDSLSMGIKPEEEAELLLTVFVAMSAGFRNYGLYCRATERIERLLPTLSDSWVKRHILLYLYMETEDDHIKADMERMTGMAETEEDKCLISLYKQMGELHVA